MSKLELFTSPSAFPNRQRIRLLILENGIVDQVEEQVLETPHDERFEHLDVFRQRWKGGESFRHAYGDDKSRLDELKPAQSAT